MAKDTELMNDVTSLEAKDEQLMGKDNELEGDIGLLQEKDVALMAKDDELMNVDLDLQAQVDALEGENLALQAKLERLLACFGTDRFLDLEITVFDCKTWLEWEKKTADNVVDFFTWSTCTGPPGPEQCPPDGEAFDYIAQLNTDKFAGHNDWRLPEVNRAGGAEELETIWI